ncbi:Uma2 family endonuclease [Scytonema millei VB511283]|uniref:Uma2 family endonuclease n=2 Tax=Scytonema TaxID=1203 RepID=A0A9X5EAE0_9CYAN|nr:Uma2 family endonuclease [Scytonema millei VB511283]
MYQTQLYHSPEEYLALEIDAEYKSEYHNGQIVPMAGGTPNHNQIAGNLYAALNFALKRQPYRVFIGDMRLWIPQQRFYTYPDVMVVSDQLQFVEGRKDTITNPSLIVEVLSESTENYDRGEKFRLYRTIPSFQEYILIEQSEMHIEQYSKTASSQTATSQWLFSEYDGETATLALTTIQFQISLSDIYDKVEFDVEE